MNALHGRLVDGAVGDIPATAVDDEHKRSTTQGTEEETVSGKYSKGPAGKSGPFERYLINILARFSPWLGERSVRRSNQKRSRHRVRIPNSDMSIEEPVQVVEDPRIRGLR